jgi:hypothetical protein
MIRLNEITLPTAMELMKPKEAEANPTLEADIYEQIKRGAITNLNQLTPFANKLSRTQYTSLARSMVDETHRSAKNYLNNEAGLVGISINPSVEKIKKSQDLDQRFQIELQTKIPDPATGVLRFQNPTEAAQAAVKNHNGDPVIKARETKRTKAEGLINNYFETRPQLKKPNVPIDEMDFSKVPGLSEGEIGALNKIKKDYKDNL